MEKEYNYKFIENKWRQCLSDPDQSLNKLDLSVPVGLTKVDIKKCLNAFGWDTFKFALALNTNPESGKSPFTNRIKHSKAFTHKIWNASRYVFMNLQGDEDSFLETQKTNTADKWILHLLNNMVDQINRSMDQFLIADVARNLHHFFWHEFCDWYLEFSKTDIQSLQTRKTLKISLLTLLKCLHPFMPFLTEEIHNIIDSNGTLLRDSPFPQFNSKWVFLREHTAIENLKTLISGTRKIKSENNLSPNRRFRIYFMIKSPEIKRDVRSNLKYYKFLIPTRKTEIIDDSAGLPGGFRAELQNMKIVLSLENETERKEYLKKLERDFEQTRVHITDVESKLADPQFVKQESESELSALKRSLLKSYKKKEKIQKTIADLSYPHE
jgi:valyl-tRNA synthetase